MDIDQLMKDFRGEALRVQTSDADETKALLWDLNCWLHKRLLSEASVKSDE